LFIPDPDSGVKKAPDPQQWCQAVLFFAIGTMTQSSTNIKAFFDQLGLHQLGSRNVLPVPKSLILKVLIIMNFAPSTGTLRMF